MRYTIQSYTFKGQQRFRIIDTMNGGNIVANQFVSEADAVIRQEQLNKRQSAREVVAVLPTKRYHSIDVVTSYYVAAHGKRPSGVGSWAFCPREQYDSDSYLDHVLWIDQSTYTDAKRAALKFFAGKTTRIVVCS
jgi:hypothetical protein